MLYAIHICFNITYHDDDDDDGDDDASVTDGAYDTQQPGSLLRTPPSPRPDIL